MNLVIDFYNVFYSLNQSQNIIKSFFEYMEHLKCKFKCSKVYICFDGDTYFKKSISKSYKIGRKEREESGLCI